MMAKSEIKLNMVRSDAYCQRRLHKGKFHWAKQGDVSLSLTPAQFDALVIGLEWQRIGLSAPANWLV